MLIKMKVRDKKVSRNNNVYCSDVLDRPLPLAFRLFICEIEILEEQI